MRRSFICGALACLLAVGCGDDAKKAAETGNVKPAIIMPGGGLGMGPGAAPEFSIPDELKPVPLEAGVATLDPQNTKVEFLCEHLPPKQPDPRLGGFEKFTGQAQIDPVGKTLKSVSIEIDTESLWTQMPQLTTHLGGPDFFDTNEHPQASFKSTSIDVKNAGTINGDLTLHGVTKPISFPATIKVGEDGLTLTARFSIDRTDFGLNFGTDSIDKKVELSVVIGDKTAPKMGGGPGGPRGGPGRGGPGGQGGPGGPGGRGNPDPVVAMFENWDTDGDGKLAGDEIPDRMRQNLEAVDTDKDGAVTLEEFQERMKAIVQQGGGRGPGGPPGGGPRGAKSEAPPAQNP
ncbi:MAG: hypothetical protein EXS05_01190 [Planctomycetaceae bacterium]|nr:hypothetical protein [Planctomycetaceae bacterium]